MALGGDCRRMALLVGQMHINSEQETTAACDGTMTANENSQGEA